jgi:hypothetical protein
MQRLLLIVLVVLTFSCSKDKKVDRPSKKAFYYWQTSLYNFSWGDSLFRTLDVDRLYFRLFDVDWNSEVKAPVPVSPLEWGYYYISPGDTIETVPVIFITNKTFKNLDEKGSVELAHHIYKKLMARMSTLMASVIYDEGWWEQNPYNLKSKNFRTQAKHDSVYAATLKTIREIQFDCDWTKSTRDKYFAFLTEAKKLFKDRTITSTIRLYQYKYPKEAGLPPVTRGMLMCYNAGSISDSETTNSVFDKSEIMDYLDADEYPIPLDYALPVFEWAVLFQNGKFTAILPADILRERYIDRLSNTRDNIWAANEDFVFGNTASSIYIRQGDELRFEEPAKEDIEAVAEWISEHKNNSDAAITFYHLNDDNLKKHSEEIKSIFDTF